VERLPKYYYKPIKEVADATYKMHTGINLFDDPEFELTLELVVTAENEEKSKAMRIAVTDISMWSLDRIED
jgi:hypothetical protein